MRSRSPRPHERSRSFLVSEGSAAHHVRFTPESGQTGDIAICLLCAMSGHWVTSLSKKLCWIARDPPSCADRLLARCVQVAIKGLRGMDVRCSPMHNDRGFHGGSRLQDHDLAE